jgi:hypothetical protein
MEDGRIRSIQNPVISSVIINTCEVIDRQCVVQQEQLATAMNSWLTERPNAREGGSADDEM